MLESGIVSLKNEVNIMMKNVVDVVLGGVTYWAFGYGFSYGDGPGDKLQIHSLVFTKILFAKTSNFSAN